MAAMAQDDVDTFTYAPNLAVVTDLDPATSYSNEVTAMHNMYESLTRYDSASGDGHARRSRPSGRPAMTA